MGCTHRIAAFLSALLLGSALGAAPADAFPTLDASFAVRMRSGAVGDFGTLSVRETGDGGLAFSIHLLDDAGPGADLKRLYLNLPSGISGLAVETLDEVHTPFELRAGGRARGGNDSRFDLAVFFGRGRGLKGNGILREANFVIRADRDLTLEDLLDETSESNRGIRANFAANLAGAGSGGPTLAALPLAPVPVPEPGTASLLGGGLLLLAARRRAIG